MRYYDRPWKDQPSPYKPSLPSWTEDVLTVLVLIVWSVCLLYALPKWAEGTSYVPPLPVEVEKP